ncbi:hypothetical protein EGI20_00400 [Aquitalea sp. S1-19]|nr:hypothetical protein [Aquitalea sp. S1-19]
MAGSVVWVINGVTFAVVLQQAFSAGSALPLNGTLRLAPRLAHDAVCVLAAKVGLPVTTHFRCVMDGEKDGEWQMAQGLSCLL